MSEKEHPKPQFFKRIVVPIARPDTATQMLELATSLIDPEEGKVIALTVGINDDGEKTAERMEAVEPIIAQFEHVELVTQIASSITRGILDGAREQRAEALLMGVHRSDRREVVLGSVVENIIEAAPCNVLIYRTGDSDDFQRVVVPLDNNAMTGMALHLGTLLAASHKTEITTPIIQRDYTSTREKEDFFRETLEVLDDDQIGKREYIQGRTPGEVLLGKLNDKDMLVLGFSQRANLDLEFGRDISDILLRRSKGPILLYSQILEEADTVTGIFQRIYQRFNPALTQVERNELVWSARKSALSSIDFNWLILMSAGLASLGLMLNSVAVIIGAMLVAPLMSPLGALAISLAVGDLSMARRATLTLLQGVALALIISIFIGFIFPISTPTQEMISRGTPTLLDAAVALVSGFVAAFALARKEIPVALAGVAIAAALMPPVCTIGLALAFGDMRLASGATLLFVTNITFIVASENLIFLWMGMRPGRQQETRRGVAAWWILIIGLVVIVVAGILRLGQEATEDIAVEDILLEQLPAAEFVNIEERFRDDGTLSVLFTVRSPEDITPQRVSELEDVLESEMDEQIVALDIINIRVVEARNQFEDDVLVTLQEQFRNGQIAELDVSLQDDEVIRVDAVLRTAETITIENVAAADLALSTQFARPIRVYLVVETVLSNPELPVEVTPEVMPEITPEAEEE
ncbi:MAG: hypothetical protein Phog2KO_20620 [Phototrophicaceae bacterium]